MAILLNFALIAGYFLKLFENHCYYLIILSVYFLINYY